MKTPSNDKWHRVVRVYWTANDQRHHEAFVFRSLSRAACEFVAGVLNSLNDSRDEYRVRAGHGESATK